MKNHQLPNPFDWSKLNIKPEKESKDHIMKNPHPCDDCGDIYNKDDLINHFRTRHKICRNCIDEYHGRLGAKEAQVGSRAGT